MPSCSAVRTRKRLFIPGDRTSPARSNIDLRACICLCRLACTLLQRRSRSRLCLRTAWSHHVSCSTAGMLVCDVMGLPLPPFILTEPIDKAIAKIVDGNEKT